MSKKKVKNVEGVNETVVDETVVDKPINLDDKTKIKDDVNSNIKQEDGFEKVVESSMVKLSTKEIVKLFNDSDNGVKISEISILSYSVEGGKLNVQLKNGKIFKGLELK